MNLLRPILIFLAGALLLTGCSFRRTVVNAQFRQIDTSFIQVGKTTADDVLRQLGPPAPFASPAENAGLISDTHLRYACLETRDTKFFISYFLILPFRWADTQTIDELLIEFDPATGAVSRVNRTRRATIRPPLEFADSRPELISEDLTGRIKP